MFDALSSAVLPFFAADPSVLVVQITTATIGFILVYLVLFTTRDIALRTNSFIVHIVCIILVAFLPVVGFLLYLLVRPSRTLRQRMLEEQVAGLLSRLQGGKREGKESKVRKVSKVSTAEAGGL